MNSIIADNRESANFLTTPKIIISENGPYLVSGNVLLSEKIIMARGRGKIFKPGRVFPQSEEYALCRCGHSKTAPFCDGLHERVGFVGTEIADRANFADRAVLLEGPELDLLDDDRCAYARFCHRNLGSAWDLTEVSDDPKCKAEAIRAASDCPAGRLVALDKTGEVVEPAYEPSIDIIQDPENEVSSGLFVKGNIPIEAADGHIYEVRNRVMLCRCGGSANKPFCDATHVTIQYTDEQGL